MMMIKILTTLNFSAKKFLKYNLSIFTVIFYFNFSQKSDDEEFFNPHIDNLAKAFGTFHECKKYFKFVKDKRGKRQPVCNDNRCENRKFINIHESCRHVSIEHYENPISHVPFIDIVLEKCHLTEGGYKCVCCGKFVPKCKQSWAKMREHLMSEFNFGPDKQPNIDNVRKALELVKPEDFRRLAKMNNPIKKNVKRLAKSPKVNRPVGRPKKK